MSRSARQRLAVAGLIGLLMAACAKPAPTVAPSGPKYPEFMRPTVPPALRSARDAARVELGWRLLQSDDLGAAEREFRAVLAANAAFYPARAGDGYVALARRADGRALAAFDMVLATAPGYVPALVGRGQALLAGDRDQDALAAFEAALAADGSLTELRARVEVLRFRGAQGVIASARKAASAGRVPEARALYQRAIAASPTSAFLYHELGNIERKAGDLAAALTQLNKAVALDAADVSALMDVAAIHEERRAWDEAAAAYRKVAAIDATADVRAKLAAVTARAREARLPPEFLAITDAPQTTRGELAALIGIRLEAFLRDLPERQVVMTDVRGSWAAPWITDVAARGVMPPFENHVFQPRAIVRRGDLATVVRNAIELASARRAELRPLLASRPAIADVSPSHLSYPAVSVAVASGVLPLLENRFQLTRPVSGAEVIEALDRLRGLVTGRP